MALCVVLVFQIAACGTLIHPERRGQTGGRIDPAIAILDGVGLLLFIIPGLVAYAIDFSTGAIYLPGTQTSAAPGDEDDATKPKVVHVDPETLDAETIARVIREETGVSVDLEDDRVDAYRYEGRELLLMEMAKVNRDVADGRVMARAHD
jgi:hypothetical protein